ncbi:MAG: hypothetical protein Q7T89_08925 [Anaerolineales bacterium]|nr:hypothetical protein [Anaerolineales bacterium]
MSTQKVTRWFFVLTFILFVGMLLTLPAQASAAQSVGASDNSCLTCHEDLYYLHDTGKLYCLANHTDRCVGCHEGNATVMNKVESHLGLLAHPQENNGAKCQECHTPQDAQVRMTNFEANNGFAKVIKAEAYTLSVEAESGFPDVAEAMIEWKWAAGASVLFGLWLLLVLFSPLKP